MKYRVSLFLLFLFACSLHVWGQDTLVSKTSKLDFLNEIDNRKWRVKIPLWIPGFRGDFGYGGVTNLPEEGDKDWPDRLEGELGVTFYLIGDVMFKPKKWLFVADGFHANLVSNFSLQNIDKIEFPAAIDGTILRSYAGYQVFERHNSDTFFKTEIYPYGGMRYMNLVIYSENTNLFKINPKWVEPVIGVRAFMSYKRWFFTGMADIGGFSINNHWSGFANLGASYRFSKLFGFGLGWSYLEFNYDDLFESTVLDLQIALAGPVVNIEFNF